MTYLIGSADTTRFSYTYGFQSVAGNRIHFNGNDTQGVVPSQNGTADTLSLYISSWGTLSNIKACLYDDNVLVESVVVNSAVGTGVIDIPLAGTTNLDTGSAYRLGIYTDSLNDITMFTDTGALTLRYGTLGNYASPEDPLPAGSYDSFNEFYWAIQETAAGLTLDSTPADINSQTQESSQVSTPATAPTTGNTEVKFDDDLGPAATVNSVSGSDPYTLNYTFPRTTAKLFSATGYPVYHEVDAEDVTSGNVPYLPVAGQTYTDLSSPVNTAGTLGETYAGSPAADGDQWVYDTNLTGDASITLTVDAQGYWILSGTPSAPSTASFYRIDSTGTVDVEDTIAFNTGPAVEAPIGTIANSQTLHPITTVVDAAPPSVVATLGTIFNPQFVYPISTLADPDTTPPVISLPTGSANGAYGATGSVTTDEDNGTIYYTATTNVSELAATIIAAGPNRFVNASGLYDVTLTGLTPETTYYMHYVHVDSAGNQSNVVSSSSFLTGEASGIPPLYRRSVNKIADYLRSTQAFSSSQTNQVVVEWLIGEGIARSNLNQMLYTYLGGLGYAGTLQDRMIAWSRDS